MKAVASRAEIQGLSKPLAVASCNAFESVAMTFVRRPLLIRVKNYEQTPPFDL